jgi:hypothetical protein
MQKLIEGSTTFHDKDIISISQDRDLLTVTIGEDLGSEIHRLMQVIFTDVIGYIRRYNSEIQGLIEESDDSEFMKEMLVLRYDPTPIAKDEKYPKDHPYKHYVFYSYEKNNTYTEPTLEVIAKSVKIDAMLN